ncbi:Lrp/AsnC ligand binding domain-containing protein, partial [Acinetobacter baumannii]|uniref:Lrp/AsnC ligand binding domain-containing protein n=1 Tax=Acinetobacter baumannii TaxID=470 RepID=UPI001FF0ED14
LKRWLLHKYLKIRTTLPFVYLCNKASQIKNFDEVINAYIITGESNYVLHVATKDLNSFSHFVINTLNKIKGVVSINSKIILQKIIQKPL